MKTPALFGLMALLAIPACRKPPTEVTVAEVRPETTKDRVTKVGATSDERFRDARPSPVKATTPEGWLALPTTQMRLLNYRFGQSGQGEVWVSISSGTVLDNVNRWLGQFGATKVDATGLATMKQVPLAGIPGVWVEAEGPYASGMGAAEKSGFALAGVVAESQGRIITVKMVGPKDEVASAKGALDAFSRSLTVAE